MTFDAADVAKVVNAQPQSNDPYGAPSTPDPSAGALREFLFGHTPPNYVATPKSIGRRLRNHMDEPVKSRERTLILRKQQGPPQQQADYFVEVEGLMEGLGVLWCVSYTVARWIFLHFRTSPEMRFSLARSDYRKLRIQPSNP